MICPRLGDKRQQHREKKETSALNPQCDDYRAERIEWQLALTHIEIDKRTRKGIDIINKHKSMTTPSDSCGRLDWVIHAFMCVRANAQDRHHFNGHQL